MEERTYAPVPFWSWNDRLLPHELRRQIQEMNHQGLGGFFMHARGGLRTSYLSEDWMDAVSAATEEGLRLGMEPWLYDENGWPSGFAAGRLPERGEPFQQKYLRLKRETLEEARDNLRSIAYYHPESAEHIPYEPVDPSQELLVAEYEVNPYYVDTLTREVTEQFIRETHERYYRTLDPDIWRGIRGFFTDEPQVSRNGIPWSPAIVSAYAEQYGEELIPFLPRLFMKVGAWEETRFRFWLIVTRLFSENFFLPIHQWCRRHGVELTGHLVKEETYADQVQSNGACMPHYEFFDVPGMDWLGRGRAVKTTPVQVASVAAQLGKRAVLSETFALCGWHVRFEELKRIYQWQMVHGVTLLCPHLQGYTLRGLRKRDYPPSLFYQQPWWPEWQHFTRYVSRVGRLLASGKPRCGVLVLHGQSSAWLTQEGEDNRGWEPLFNSLLRLCDELNALGIPFHFGDEVILERHGTVEEGPMEPAESIAGALAVGRMRYNTVIVPRILNLFPGTLELLERAAAAGVVVRWVGSPELLIGGRRKPDTESRIRRIARIFEDERAAVVQTAEETAFSLITSQGSAERSILGTAREGVTLGGTSGELRYFINSADRAPTERLEAGDSRTGAGAAGLGALCTTPVGDSFCTIYRVKRDELEHVPADRIRDGLYRFELLPGEDLLLFLSRDRPKAREPAFRERPVATKATSRTIETTRLPEDWEVVAMTPNVLTLDYCDYWIDGEAVKRNQPVQGILDEVLALKRGAHVKLRFQFHVREGAKLPPDFGLLMEDPESWSITLNGHRLSATDGWRHDSAFTFLPVRSGTTGGANNGTNELVLESFVTQREETYQAIERARVFESEKNMLTFDREIESVYLSGHFGVATEGEAFVDLGDGAERYHGRFAISEAPNQVTISEIHRCGLPFFSGRITLGADIDLAAVPSGPVYFELDEMRCNSVSVTINGRDQGTIFWLPYALEISSALKQGSNRIEVELVNSLRNMLGPHHLAAGESSFVGPFSFFPGDGVFARTWEGTLNPWSHSYVFQRFGLEGARLTFTYW